MSFLDFFKSNKKQAEESDFVDISFNIQALKEEVDHITFDALTSDNSMGFKAIIYDRTSKVILGENIDAKITTTANGVILKSLGTVSDRLLSYLLEKYKLPENHSQMKEEVNFTSLALLDDCSKITTQLVKFKLFYEKAFDNPESKEATSFYENEYFEVYFNVDIPNKIVELGEKDFGYRKQLVKGFGK